MIIFDGYLTEHNLTHQSPCIVLCVWLKHLTGRCHGRNFPGRIMNAGPSRGEARPRSLPRRLSAIPEHSHNRYPEAGPVHVSIVSCRCKYTKVGSPQRFTVHPHGSDVDDLMRPVASSLQENAGNLEGSGREKLKTLNGWSACPSACPILLLWPLLVSSLATSWRCCASQCFLDWLDERYCGCLDKKLLPTRLLALLLIFAVLLEP